MSNTVTKTVREGGRDKRGEERDKKEGEIETLFLCNFSPKE